MKPPRILAELARCYERSHAGRTGAGARDWIIDYEELLRRSGCHAGEERAEAERDLQRAAAQGLIALVPHRRDARLVETVRLSLADEARFYDLLGTPSPTGLRIRLAEQFRSAAGNPEVPAEWRDRWNDYLDTLAAAAQNGGPVQPFDRSNFDANAELLEILPRLLAWNGESLLRFASCILRGDSKWLERSRGRIETALNQLTGGAIQSLEQIGILENPRFVLLHGPLRLRFGSNWLDLGLLAGATRISGLDLERADEMELRATRCLTVENETTFHELAKLRSGTLLIQTSYPGSGTLALLKRLPGSIEYWHFGDSDPQGFDILRDLRERSARPFRALHMKFRPGTDSPKLSAGENRLLESLLASSGMGSEHPDLTAMLRSGTKGLFEQESLGRPRPGWPFYDQCGLG